MTGLHKMYNLRCPLCCGKTFNSKQSLVDHLSSHRANFTCPICQKSYSTITNLINHLNMTTCKPTNLNSIIASADQSLNELAQTKSKKNFDDTTVLPKIESVRSQGNSNINNGDDHEYEDLMKNNHELPELQESNLGATNMYEELLGKDALQGGDLQLLEENGHDRYTIVAHEGLPAIMHNGTLISKQNSDGTISFTSAKDEDEEDEMLKLEPELEPVITVADKDPESNEQELYSCNTCGVSFSSVLEHIQAYHKDQDVVVEVNEQSQIDDVEESQEGERQLNTDDQPLDSVALKDNKLDTAEGQPMKRVITDTGAIVEEASFFPIIEVQGKDEEAKAVPLSLLEEEEVFDKKGLVFTRRYVQVEKFNNPDPLKAEEVGTAQSKLPYHQVVIKEIVTMDGGAKMKVYNCVACSVYVTNLDEFKSHPCRLLKYICPHCPVSYDNARSLCAHMKVHKTTKSFAKGSEVPPNEIKEYPVEVFNGPYRCDICTTVFPSNKSLKLHRRMHDPIKARPIEPPVDDNSDPSEDASEKYFCSQCSKWIPVGYRSVHSNFHKSTENFNCDICNKKFSSSSYLAMHMTVHNTEKVKVKKPDKTLPYVCLYCNRQFARPHEKVKHERIHTGEKPHSCEICGKSFRVSYCLTLHMRTHTGARPYACQHCGKRFKAHSVYNHHLLTHSDVRAYKCPFCPKAFKTSVQLAGHKNSHTKPFSCTHCNRPFASLYAVRVHTETHRRQNNLKFSCKSCGASYARSFALKDHMRQIHNQEVDDKDYYVPIAAQNANPSDWAVDSAEEQSDTPPRKDFQEINDLAMSSNESETVMT